MFGVKSQLSFSLSPFTGTAYMRQKKYKVFHAFFKIGILERKRLSYITNLVESFLILWRQRNIRIASTASKRSDIPV